MSDTMLGRAFNTVRNFAEDTLERVEKRWDQAMDVIHARPIRDPTRDAEQTNTRERLLEKFATHRPISWEVVGDRQILPFVDSKENGTMDSEVKAAKQHVREREQERWTRVEQIGRQAIDSDRARVTEKPTVTTEADLATKAERQRPQTA